MALDPDTDPRVLRTLWFPLRSAPSALKGPASRGTGPGDRLPQAQGDRGTQRRPRSHFQQDTSPTLTAGFITVGNSHRTCGT